ncbi:MAG: rhomboid family intramembrane serine protease [Opitutales bacterium]
MGLADRNYMRGDPGSPRVPATNLLLGVFVGIFVLGLVADAARANFLGWMPLRDQGFAPWSWVTYALVHGGIFHLAGNGFSLWFVGPIVEAEQGRATFWRVLLVGTLAGALAWWLTGLGSVRHGEMIGASAAIAALLVYGLADRRDEGVTILLFFFLPVSMRIRWLLRGLWAISLCGWVFSELPGHHTWTFWQPVWRTDVAHSAHLGGLLAGSAMVWLARRREDGRFQIQQTTEPAAAASFVVKPTAPITSATDARAELDRLLDKISAEGFGSLTPEERLRLESLSSRLR